MKSLVLHLDDNMCELAFWKFLLSVIFPFASPVKSGMQSCEQKHFYYEKEKYQSNCIQHKINKPLMVGKWPLEINPEVFESSLIHVQLEVSSAVSSLSEEVTRLFDLLWQSSDPVASAARRPHTVKQLTILHDY